MKIFKNILFSLFVTTTIAILITGCYYDNEEVLYPSISSVCDTTNVTYSKTISSIISDNCISCHGASYITTGSGIRLDNYNALKAKVDDVFKAINHDPQWSAMPKNSAKLNNCKLKQFEIWYKAGAPNN